MSTSTSRISSGVESPPAFGGKVTLLKGNGDGTFQAPEDYRTLTSPLGLAAADLNADGSPDLAVVAAGMSVLLNTGTNGVTSSPRLLDIYKPPD